MMRAISTSRQRWPRTECCRRRVHVDPGADCRTTAQGHPRGTVESRAMDDRLLDLVPPDRARPALAPDARSLRRPRQRGDAAADAGCARRAAVRAMARPLADGAALADASRADVIREWQGLGVQPPGGRAARGRAARRRRRLACRPDGAPGVGPYTAAAIRNFAWASPSSRSTRTSAACRSAPATHSRPRQPRR